MPFFASPTSKSGTHKRKLLLAASVTAGVAMFGGAAHADIIFTPGNHPSGNEQNIQFEASLHNILSFDGDTNQTQSPIQFDLIPTALNGETSIGTMGQGQAAIICTSGCGTGGNGMQLTDLEIKLGPGLGATDFIGNPENGEGTALITVTDQMGHTFTDVLGNGQNFFTLNATMGDVITDIQITEDSSNTGAFGFDDFKQPRISGLCVLQAGGTCREIPIPEPSSLAVAGAGLIAAGWFARRRKVRCRA